MATDAKFDPYYHWLGIPPKERPLNFYRLLSLELFESDESVIRMAVKRQIAFLKSTAEDEHPELSEKILSQIKAAGSVLLDPQKRAAYENKLKAQMFDAQQQEQAEAAPAPKKKKPKPQQQPESDKPTVTRSAASKHPIVTSIGPPPGSSSGSYTTQELQNAAKRRKQQKKQQAILTSAVAVACVIVLGMVGVYVMTRGDGQTVATAENGNGSNGNSNDPKARGADSRTGRNPGSNPAPTVTPRVSDIATKEPTEPKTPEPTPPVENAGEGELKEPTEPVTTPSTEQPIEPPTTTEPQPALTGAGANGEVEAIFTAAVAAVNDGRLDDASDFLKDYLGNEVALKKIEAQLLLEDIQNAPSDRFAVEFLLQLPDANWQAFSQQVGLQREIQITIPPPNYEYPVLQQEFNASISRNIPRAFQLWGMKKEGTEIEPYLVAIGKLPKGAPTTLPDPAAPDAAEPEDAVVEEKPEVPAEPEEVGDPTEYLTGKGLVENGKAWLLPGEEEISDRIKEINDAKKQILVAEKKIPSRGMQQLKQEKENIVQGEKMLEQMTQVVRQAGVMTNTQQQKMSSLRAQLDEKKIWVINVETQLAEPLEAIRTAKSDYSQAVDAGIQFVEELEGEYAILSTNPSVQQALDMLKGRLGPSSDVNRERDRMAKLKEKLVEEAEREAAAAAAEQAVAAPGGGLGNNIGPRIQNFGPNAQPPVKALGPVQIGGF